MGWIGNLFQNDKLEAVKMERDYYKRLYEDKLADMDAMRQTLAGYKDRVDSLASEVVLLRQQVSKKAKNTVVELPDVEVLF